MAERCHILVRGYVQGVSFRWYTKQLAATLGLKGWVRNLQDGSVEVMAEGEHSLLAELAAWAQEGPSEADVSGVSVEYTDATGEFGGFTIR